MAGSLAGGLSTCALSSAARFRWPFQTVEMTITPYTAGVDAPACGHPLRFNARAGQCPCPSSARWRPKAARRAATTPASCVRGVIAATSVPRSAPAFFFRDPLNFSKQRVQLIRTDSSWLSVYAEQAHVSWRRGWCFFSPATLSPVVPLRYQLRLCHKACGARPIGAFWR